MSDTEHEREHENREIIGHVVGDDSEAVTVCDGCYDGDSAGAIYDSEAYGSEVPYPECWVCGEVMRPNEE